MGRRRETEDVRIGFGNAIDDVKAARMQRFSHGILDGLLHGRQVAEIQVPPELHVRIEPVHSVAAVREQRGGRQPDVS